MTNNLYNYDNPVSDFEIEVPNWINPDISVATIAEITESGCNSGAYMPAVSYGQALETMNEHGNDVIEFIEARLDKLPDVSDQGWSQMACTYLSCAVELWAASIINDLVEATGEKQ